MKRTTISLPDDLAAALDREARRCGVSVSQIAREAIEVRLRRTPAQRRFSWIGIADSGEPADASERVEEIIRDELLDDVYRDAMGLDPP